MSTPTTAQPFLYVTCPVGSEAVVRGGIPGHRPAFARPGTITFKTELPVLPDGPRPHPLARTWGVSLGVDPQLDALPDRLVLQVRPGEAGPPGKVPPSVDLAWAEDARNRAQVLADELGARVTLDPPKVGDAVLVVIVRPDERPIYGWHLHSADRGPLPGGRWPLSPPKDAPSRAWAKLEELIAWSGSTPRPGERVLELGCAPGGATVALLDRGLVVTGVDPQPMALPPRLADAPFVHLRQPIEAVERDRLPDEVEWIVGDASVAAPVAVHALLRLVKRYRPTLRGVLVTLKLNEWALVDRIPDLIEQLAALGLEPRGGGAAHLPSFRQEVGVVLAAPAGAAFDRDERVTVRRPTRPRPARSG
ncbi:MAG: SAM-dependent methyltransferase [Myxococcota bacterium]